MNPPDLTAIEPNGVFSSVQGGGGGGHGSASQKPDPIEPRQAPNDLAALDPTRWEVTVRVEGVSVLTIGSHGYLAGYEDIDRFGDAVRGAAEHLRSFIGSGEPVPGPGASDSHYCQSEGGA